MRPCRARDAASAPEQWIVQSITFEGARRNTDIILYITFSSSPSPLFSRPVLVITIQQYEDPQHARNRVHSPYRPAGGQSFVLHTQNWLVQIFVDYCCCSLVYKCIAFCFLTECVASVADELPPLGCLDLPLVRQLDVVPPRKAVLQVPLRLSMPVAAVRHVRQVPHTHTRKRERVTLTHVGM